MKKKKIIIISLVVMLLVTSVITFSYAFWGITNEQTTMNKLTSGCLSITLEGEDAISLNNAFPITDEDGMKLKPYSFTISNTCDLFVSYNVSLEILKDSTLPIKYVRSMLNKEAVVNINTLESTTKSISDSIDSKILTTGSLGSGDSADYTLRIWMDEDVTVDDTDAINKTLLSKVTVTATPSSYSPVANGFTNLAEALLVNEYQTTNVDVAKNKIASKQEVDFSKTAPRFIYNKAVSNTQSTISFTKADPALIGSYGIVTKTTQIALFETYEFDTETAYYNLSNYAYYNPEDVDYSAKDYYICISNITSNTNDELSYANGTSCSTLYKVTGLKSVEDVNFSLASGTKINAKKYTYNTYIYDAYEVESDKSDKGLYEAPDDFGISYYYRGNVTNNIVKFAGFYWHIIRINGDGSIRMIYAGSTANDKGANTTIGKALFNLSGDDPTYLGYMYSNTLNTSYIDAIKNEKDSNIKTKLDVWYKTNIIDTGYSSYIADSGFCNNRKLLSGTGYKNDAHSYYISRDVILTNYNPSLICPNASNDLFTTSSSSYGNKELTYPIGTITMEELLGGGLQNGALNSKSYLSVGVPYWGMTPNYYNGSRTLGYFWACDSDGMLKSSNVKANNYIRPVINLKSTTEITGGIGTKNDPFIIK